MREHVVGTVLIIHTELELLEMAGRREMSKGDKNTDYISFL